MIRKLYGTFAILMLFGGTALAAKTNFQARLIGSEEVPARVTDARGTATFHRNKAGTELTYRLTVSRIENVTAAHIHLGAAGENGAPVVLLYGPVAAGGGKKNGVLASGSITAADLIGPLAGKTLADLVAEMTAGRAYVNVHTDDGAGEPNSRSGDFPDGEIRGQIK